jgi:hypothetical protein
LDPLAHIRHEQVVLDHRHDAVGRRRAGRFIHSVASRDQRLQVTVANLGAVGGRIPAFLPDVIQVGGQLVITGQSNLQLAHSRDFHPRARQADHDGFRVEPGELALAQLRSLDAIGPGRGVA